MARTKQIHKTKIVFKLPKGIIGKIEGAYSTSANVTIEGYTGPINILDSSKKIPRDLELCRPAANHGGKAWVRIN